MGVPAVVFHKGGLAHYQVSINENGDFIAILQRFDGKPGSEPQKEVSFRNGEEGLVGNCSNSRLTNDLFNSVKNRLTIQAQ